MRVTGTTFEAYLPVDAARLARLRVMGLTAQRAIAHNGGIYRMEGKTWPQESGYLDVVLDLCRVHGFKTLYDTLNHDALPWWSPTGDWKSANTKFDEATFRAWLADYIAYMTPSGLDYRLVWGNEPDADGSPYLKDEAAFRNRYRMVAEKLKETKGDRENYIQAFIAPLQQQLEEAKIKAQI